MPEEDKIITESVAKLGLEIGERLPPHKWDEIAAQLPGRSAEAARKHQARLLKDAKAV